MEVMPAGAMQQILQKLTRGNHRGPSGREGLFFSRRVSISKTQGETERDRCIGGLTFTIPNFMYLKSRMRRCWMLLRLNTEDFMKPFER